ncbi:hypothetical protein CANMA_003488 [Candida margitis]|uniref:uncharacterized protein n=1 Tax=Candida margitis TaxID=1775924 RepID=UPI0022267A7D|nr:uncharacterized protein CANMA_003488 [Candida margitis]KAI5964977.1 hypothetical protein CANMA_003488 [Candida margitis]
MFPSTTVYSEPSSQSSAQLSTSMVNICHQSILNTIKLENEAVAHLQHQYETDSFSIDNLLNSITTLYQTHCKGGKIVITGIGKSHKLASKLVATFNSLSIQSSCLHPSEALHGDLGVVDFTKDCLIMLTASGNTPELINLLPHLSMNLPIILLTCNKFSNLSTSNRISSLLLAELPNSHNEESIHGLPAPTVSTTLSLILADSAILALSEIIEQDLIKRKKLFGLKHPGGSIGAYLNSDTGSSLTSDGSTTSLLSLKNEQPGVKSSSTSNTKSNHTLDTTVSPTTIPKTSSISSDCQGLEIYASSHLEKNNSTTAATTNVRLVSHDEIIQIDEITVLKWISLFDCLQIKQTDLKTEIMHVRQLYRQCCCGNGRDEDSNWSKFKWELLRSFK